MAVRLKIGITLVLTVAAALSILVFYVPEHWLRKVDFASVTVDNRPVQAHMYLGNPTTNEAEAFLLVIIPGEGNYLFNFLDENFRAVSSREFVQLYGGAITFKPMSKGPWAQPLPFLETDEFRVTSLMGHIVKVKL